MTNQVALQLYTLRNELKTPEDISRTLAEVARIGYRAVQVSGVGPIEPAAMKKILERENLTACSSHIPYQRLVGETEKVIEEARFLDQDSVACPQLPGELRTSAAGFRQAARELSEAGKAFQQAGLVLLYHNHALEFERFEGRTGYQILVEESDPRFLQMEIDTYWVAFAGADPVDWCRKLAGRMHLVHFKDMGIQAGKQFMAEVGEGNLNWPAILTACRDGGVRWYAVEQDTCPRPPLESARISLENLKRMGLE
ncbi:MAG TPA: sugar phosphate isomerase/epimerase [bacterium]|uniref:Inosose dehydratase n=1 Tax=candidate division TA06 bacterium ADurb.Bin417 TaxID=1852828 RepID=A0A1V5MKZ4_UNCT6|nr:MAG: Inosose dehydratase [candidate division TA06 bacterium ADurb.Bin417]HNQ34445.1 sugar phosphate isomerase/epimerase [bacterium]HNS48145.1 sugar phosphate isomerase/epimerase [bacterium]